MSDKTRTTHRDATIGPFRAVRLVPNQSTAATDHTDTEDKLWAALHAHPNSTATDLSAAAKIGKSTAQKILAKWTSDGSVSRIPGIAEGGRRAADLWAIAATDTNPNTADDGTVAATVAVPTDPRTQDDTVSDDVALNEPTTTLADQNPTDAADTIPTEEDLAESTDSEFIAVPTYLDANDDAEPASTEATTSAAKAHNTAKTASSDATDGKPERLVPGALRGMVEDHLRDHPGEQFGPVAIAKALGGKSSGAVSNALDRLVKAGIAVKTQDTPRRFGLAAVEQVATAAC